MSNSELNIAQGDMDFINNVTSRYSLNRFAVSSRNLRTRGSINKKFAQNALMRLHESLQRQEWRYVELLHVSRELSTFFDKVRGKSSKDPLMARSEDFKGSEEKEFSLLQLATVDKNEAFHQQVYAVLGNLCYLMQYCKLYGIQDKPSTRNNTLFITFLRRSLQGQSILLDYVKVLEFSKDYRGAYVDHPQDNSFFDYETVGYEGQFFIAYLKTKPKGLNSQADFYYPHDSRFRTKANVGMKFFVSPDNRKTFEASLGLVGSLLGATND